MARSPFSDEEKLKRGRADPHGWAKHCLNLLQPFGWPVWRFSYYGSGDSLNDTYLYIFKDHGEYDKDAPDEIDRSDKIPNEVKVEVEEFALTMVDAHYAGFENNEGGHGEVDFIIRPGPEDEDQEPRVRLRHWDYEQVEHERESVVWK